MPKLGYYCSKCDQRKDEAEFYPNRFKGRPQRWCKSCCSNHAHERYISRRDEILARNKAWALANPEKRRECARRQRDKNAEKYRSGVRRWRESHKDYDAFRSKYRKAMKKLAVPLWANGFFMQEAYRLAQIRTKSTGIEWHVDHIVPLQSSLVCGLHCEQNLQLLPGRLNHAKGNRWWPDMP